MSVGYIVQADAESWNTVVHEMLAKRGRKGGYYGTTLFLGDPCPSNVEIGWNGESLQINP